MIAGDVIREARLRAGLSQHQLAARSGRDRSVIARWEQGVVSPSLETLIEIVNACGFDLPLELVTREPGIDPQLVRNARLTPERRVQQMLRAQPVSANYDPFPIVAVLERHRVRYVLIGALARVIHGAAEQADRVDVAPALRADNLERLRTALADFGHTDRSPTGSGSSIDTPTGRLVVTLEPEGARRGFDDLRRAATREPIGKGLRPPVASPADLARLLAASCEDADRPKLRQLRQLLQLQRQAVDELAAPQAPFRTSGDDRRNE